MKKIIYFLILTFSIPFYAQTILTVDFETEGQNYTLTNGGIFSTEDYITRSYNGDASASHANFTGAQGTYYLAGRDIQAQTGGIDIAGYLNIADVNVNGADTVGVSISVGARNAAEYESVTSSFGNDYIYGEYSFNGTDWTKFCQFTGNSSANEGYMSEDTDLNGTGNGTVLSESMTQFAYPIPISGTTLKLRFAVYNSSSQEVFAMDNIVISGEVSQPLSPPQNLMTVSVTSSQADLQWDSVSGAAMYRIYRSTDPYGTFTEVGTSSVNTYSDTGVSAGNKYFYYVVAVN
jgi:hypothetical protein